MPKLGRARRKSGFYFRLREPNHLPKFSFAAYIHPPITHSELLNFCNFLYSLLSDTAQELFYTNSEVRC
jgi:hypothetical protein